MRSRYIYLFIVVLCFSLKVEGQQVFTIHGVVSKGLSGQRVAKVLVKNLHTKEFIESDEVGWFAIKASVGDTLEFIKNEFANLKIAVANSGDLPVYLQPVIALNEVKIQGQTKRQELSDVMQQYRSQGTYYDGKPPLLSFLTSPITGLYELFGTTPSRERRFKTFSKGEIEYTEVEKRYTPALVKRVTNASDTVVKKFMLYYTPSFEDMKEWNDYQLIKHIREHFEFYDKTADKDKLQQMVLPPLIAPEKKKNS